MTRKVFAIFDDGLHATQAIAAARAHNFELCDAFSPYPLDIDAGAIAGRKSIGWAALAGAVIGGGGIFALETYSAAFAYPFNSGGRPVFSWPVFLLAPFEIGVLFAAFFAFAAFLWRTGLPRLSHPVFEIDGLERASQDQILLLFIEPASDIKRTELRDLLSGALELREIAP